MQSNAPAMLIQYKMTKKAKKHVPQEDDKNCLSTKYYKSKLCSDKKCQEISNVQMRPKKPRSHMWSVTNKIDMWLKKPAIKSSNKKLIGLASDKNCQASICYIKKKKLMCSDKNCQENENINMQPVMPEMDMQLLKPAIRR